ncbi:MAG: flippase-like domain-containing protein, partial [Gemmatimonadota bacterium]|nr:flippase-like domain-containing protein [Gemmatimonadota bacterium]
ERPRRRLAVRMDSSPRMSGGLVHRGLLWVVESVDHYTSACTQFIRKDPIVLLWSALLTVALYANKFTLGYLVMRGMGVDAPYLEVIAVQALLQFIVFVAPSPGGSGIAELTTAALMARFLDAHLLGVYTLASRFFQLYLPATLGCFVLIAALKPMAARSQAPGTALPAEGAVVP